MKRAWIVLLATMVLIIPVRLYASFSLVDPKTGFYTDGGTLALAAMIVAIAGIAAVVLLCRRSPVSRAETSLRSAPAAAFAALTGMFVGGQSLTELTNLTGQMTAAAQQAERLQAVQVMDFVFAASGLFAAVAFLMAAYDFGSGETMLRRHPLIALWPSLWGCLSLISLFIDYAAVADQFDNVYHTCTTALLLLFLFSQAKQLSGVDGGKDGRQIFPYGFAAAVLALSDAVPNLALAFSGRNMLGTFPLGLHMVNIILSVYILAYLAAVGRAAPAAESTAVPGTEGKTADADPKQPDAFAREGKPSDDGSVPEYLDFLRSAYHSAEVFQESGKNITATAEKVKS